MAKPWFNNRLPQELVIAMVLLYLQAFWSGVEGIQWLFEVVGISNPLVGVDNRIGALSLAVSILSVLGARGIAAELKPGWRTAIAATGLLAVTELWVYGADWFDNIVNVMFTLALLALLLYGPTRRYVNVWFSEPKRR
ncbi:MAG: hypothetical protein KDB86_06215 [Actinobacteria bacterium]|nr:hypothetical protein [Actinomycetota bacterium]MCB9388927.1 hypothetical protein [Acidimicrobiia bacterium]